MIGSNFSLRVSICSGNTQLVQLDPGRGTLVGAENPAKSMVITHSSGSTRSWRCVSGFHIMLESPTVSQDSENED